MKFKLLIIITLTSITYTCTLDGVTEGERIYTQHCANCHMEEGQGLRGLIPPLNDTHFLQENSKKIPCWIRHGMQGSITVNKKEYDQIMPGVDELTEAQIANVINFISKKWNKDLPFYSEIDVKEALKECQ